MAVDGWLQVAVGKGEVTNGGCDLSPGERGVIESECPSSLADRGFFLYFVAELGGERAGSCLCCG